MFSTRTCQPIPTVQALRHHDVAVQAASVRALNGRTLVATGDRDGVLRLIQEAPGGHWRTLCQLDVGVGAIADIDISKRGTMLAVAGETSEPALVDLDGERCGTPRPLIGHLGRVYSVDIAPHGKQVVTASLDKTARVWRLDGTVQALLADHQDRVYQAIFSPNDGRWLLTSSRDGAIRLWRAPLQQQEGSARLRTFLPMMADLGGVARAVFSPDGAVVAGAYWDNAALLWRVWSQPETASSALVRRWGPDRGRLALIREAHRLDADGRKVPPVADK